MPSRSTAPGAIHDFELCYQGETSEDVQRGLERRQLRHGGRNGPHDECGARRRRPTRTRCRTGARRSDAAFPTATSASWRPALISNIPVTAHIGIGTDIIHQHPTTRGEVLGEASYRDFQTFAAVCAQLEGGVVLNVGSAVIMPEVFLKR